MTFSSLLLTVMCCVLLVESAQKGSIDLSSPHTTAAQVEAAYKISNSAATSQYNNGQAGEPEPVYFCYHGPITRAYSRPGYFYWPPISIKQCDGLYCGHPTKCVASHTRSVNRWAVVYSVHNSQCYYVRSQYLRLLEHVSCQCRQCTYHSDCPAPRVCDSSWTCQCPGSYCQVGYRYDRRICRCLPDGPPGPPGIPGPSGIPGPPGVPGPD